VAKSEIKEKIQQEAYQKWLENDKIGTVELATGMGKTFVAFRAILSMPKGSNVLFLAETDVREKTVLDDTIEYKKFYGINPLEDYNFKFACYQGAYKYSILDYFPNTTENNTIIIMDEIHDLLSTARYKFVQNSLLDTPLCKIPRLGLSATIDKKTIYEIQGIEITKFDLLRLFCPIVYIYSLQESIDNHTTRELKFFVLKHNLDFSIKRIKAGKKDAPFMTTELAQYAYLNKRFREAQFSKSLTGKAKTDFVLAQASNRARFLYTLPSKVVVCKSLLNQIPGKTLVFGKGSDCLLSICPNAIVDKNTNKLRDLSDFKKGITQQCASEIILKQGENIPLLDNIILLAYYSKVKDFVQFVGRCRQDKQVGSIIIFVTSGTQEEVWFQSMTEEMKVDFIYCQSVNELLSKL